MVQPIKLIWQKIRYLVSRPASRTATGSDSVTLSLEQRLLIKELEKTNGHAFITGKAGSGKSVVLRQFVATTSKRVIVTAPTGVAALNVKGQTIHSLFKLLPGFVDIRQIKLSNQTKLLLRDIDAIVIDEISMVRADTLDGIDYILRQAKGSTLAFGGAQLIAFGDLYQLPPVVETTELRRYFATMYDGPYFFNARVWNHAKLITYELQQVFRQSDSDFISLLERIRHGQPSTADFNLLRSRVMSTETNVAEPVITLASTNIVANITNSSHLSELKTKLRIYQAEMTGQVTEQAFPAESTLQLKVGAQVVFLRNDTAKRWVNGSIGVVRSVAKNTIRVRYNGTTHIVGRVTWDKLQYTYNAKSASIEQTSIGSCTQFPLKLAWAITIHKSQGCSFENAIIDLSAGAFMHGQTYVALSRCRSLAGLHLASELNRHDIVVDGAIIDFMEQAKHIRATRPISPQMQTI